MKIVEVTPNESVKWHCLEGDPEWLHTALSFKLVGKGFSI